MDEFELCPRVCKKIVLCSSYKSVLFSQGETSPGWENTRGNAVTSHSLVGSCVGNERNYAGTRLPQRMLCTRVGSLGQPPRS